MNDSVRTPTLRTDRLLLRRWTNRSRGGRPGRGLGARGHPLLRHTRTMQRVLPIEPRGWGAGARGRGFHLRGGRPGPGRIPPTLKECRRRLMRPGLTEHRRFPQTSRCFRARHMGALYGVAPAPGGGSEPPSWVASGAVHSESTSADGRAVRQLAPVALTCVHPVDVPTSIAKRLATPPVHCSGSTVLAGRGPAAPKGGEFQALR